MPQKDIHIPTPSVGVIVSFSYDYVQRRDIPVNPVVYRVRSDLSWDNITFNSHFHQGI